MLLVCTIFTMRLLYLLYVLFYSCCFWFVEGIVRTSVIVTGVQVCSRIFMVWFITNSIRQVSTLDEDINLGIMGHIHCPPVDNL